MLTGEVTDDGEVLVHIPVAGRTWRGVIDTGFNGFLELPETLFEELQPVFNGPVEFILAGGLEIEQDVFMVDFPFDGVTVTADATFVESDIILIGTGMLRTYRLEVDFVARTVLLERVAAA